MGYAQKKELPVHEQLAQSGDRYKVKIKNSISIGVPRYSFGPFKVTESKVGWIESARKSKIWSPQVLNVTDNKASFKLSDGETTANVNSFFFAKSNYEEPLELFTSDFFTFAYGDEVSFEEETLFTATITLGDEVAEEWLLTFKSVEDYESYQESLTILSNGVRKINLKHINSPLKGGLFDSPALGYEFWEEDQVLGAVKYFPGRAAYNAVWLGEVVDTKDRLLLSAASVAILYLKSLEI